MMIALTFLALLVAAVASLSLRLTRPGFAYHWLIATVGALVAWLLLLFANIAQPTSIYFAIWKPETIFDETSFAIVSPFLFLDSTSWAFSLAVVAVLLSAILVSLARSNETMSSDTNFAKDPACPRPTWQDLAGMSLVAAASLLAICAGNLFTLLLVWALVDMIEFIAWLVKVDGEQASQRLVLAFASRAVSLILLLWATILTQSDNLTSTKLVSSTITALDPAVTPYLLSACAIRLCILPLSSSLSRKIHAPSAVMIAMNLIPLASSLALVCRIAAVGIPQPWNWLFEFLVAIMAITGSLRWLVSREMQDGLAGWIICLGALTSAAALRQQPEACQALGMTTLLSGGFIFFFQIRPNWLRPFSWIGALSLTALPWTPTWPTVQLYASPFRPLLVVTLLAQAGLLAGTIRYLRQAGPKSLGVERWVWALYLWGLVLLGLAFGIILWRVRAEPASLIASWPGGVSLLLAGGLLWISGKILSPAWMARTAGITPILLWAVRMLWRIIHSTRYLLKWSNTLLESQAGILWSFLALILLLTLFSQANWGR